MTSRPGTDEFIDRFETAAILPATNAATPD
jgi:hypothetical protein